ncbi:MAG: hypothetical protein R3B07_15115 [Polyangiaceae bacterium]
MGAEEELELRPANGCIKNLTWECHANLAALPGFLVSLTELGYVESAPLAQLRRFTNASGDEFVIVLTSGRCQVRLSYLTPGPEREQRARAILNDVLTHCRTAALVS